ncbi:otoferlin-like [Aphis craccivora]|uniref:Otoferlin-like n=1 Tax=Aphis craccivora TaxID=307492 RepID=A0A6G0VVX0_APHCR|nr:otoferlin-like [Aphis craccivora]
MKTKRFQRSWVELHLWNMRIVSVQKFKIKNKPRKIITVLYSNNNTTTLMDLSRKKKLKAKDIHTDWRNEVIYSIRQECMLGNITINMSDRFLNYKTKYFDFITEFVYTYNIENKSVNANLDELLIFIANNSHKNNIDVIVLTETWHDVENCNINVLGYNTLFSKKKRNQNDGIIILIKNSFKYEFFEYNFDEANKIPITLFCMYRSPSNDIHKFLTILNDILSTEKNESGFTVILGDININIIGIDNSDNEYLDMLSITPTGFNHSCIDHIFIKNNKQLKNFNAGVIQTNFSDHFSMILSMPVTETINTSKCNTINYIDFKKIDTNLKSEL